MVEEQEVQEEEQERERGGTVEEKGKMEVSKGDGGRTRGPTGFDAPKKPPREGAAGIPAAGMERGRGGGGEGGRRERVEMEGGEGGGEEREEREGDVPGDEEGEGLKGGRGRDFLGAGLTRRAGGWKGGGRRTC